MRRNINRIVLGVSLIIAGQILRVIGNKIKMKKSLKEDIRTFSFNRVPIIETIPDDKFIFVEFGNGDILSGLSQDVKKEMINTEKSYSLYTIDVTLITRYLKSTEIHTPDNYGIFLVYNKNKELIRIEDLRDADAPERVSTVFQESFPATGILVTEMDKEVFKKLKMYIKMR